MSIAMKTIGSIASTRELRRTRPVAERPLEARAAFIRRTYLHLLGGILGFAALEAALFRAGLALPIARALLGPSGLAVLGGSLLAGWIAVRVAHALESLYAQYAMLAGFAVSQAVLGMPLVLLAQSAFPRAIERGALVTLLGFAGLTVAAFTTSRAFSFAVVMWRFAGILALVLIAAGLLFGVERGLFLAVGMVALAGGVVLHQTSAVLRHYPEGRHVGAALALFASPSLLPWRALRLLLWRERQRALRPAA